MTLGTTNYYAFCFVADFWLKEKRSGNIDGIAGTVYFFGYIFSAIFARTDEFFFFTHVYTPFLRRL